MHTAFRYLIPPFLLLSRPDFKLPAIDAMKWLVSIPARRKEKKICGIWVGVSLIESRVVHAQLRLPFQLGKHFCARSSQLSGFSETTSRG